jgi:DNA-directed RNA polymerase subunit RPC12/RpoP
MERMQTKVWVAQVPCSGGRMERVYYLFPDMFFDVKLYTCVACGELFLINKDDEHYMKIRFEDIKGTLNCPQCSSRLANAKEYPATFIDADGNECHYLPSNTPHRDEDRVSIEVWNPLVGK